MQQEAEPSCQGAGHPVPQTVEGFTPSHPRARQCDPPPYRHSPLTGHASHGAQHSLPPPPQSSPHLGPALRAGDTCSEKLRGEPPSVFPIAPLPAAAGTHSPHCQTQCLSRRGAEACPEQVSSAKHVYALHAQGQAMCSDERGRLVHRSMREQRVLSVTYPATLEGRAALCTRTCRCPRALTSQSPRLPGRQWTPS